MEIGVTEVAREAEESPALRVLARAGYAADGLVHVLIGVIVLVVTFGGDGESDQAGAFKAVAAAPLGFVVVWAVAAALWALALYHLVEAVLVRGENAARRWAHRAGEVGQALVFGAMGVVAALVAAGAHPDGEESVETASGTLMAAPGGPVLLAVIGAGVAIGGAVFVGFGVARRFQDRMTLPDGPGGATVTVLGVVGYVAKGIALAIVGILLVAAGVTLDPDAAGGMDGAVNALLALPYGPWLGGAVGIGLIAYGLFLFARARWARL